MPGLGLATRYHAVPVQCRISVSRTPVLLLTYEPTAQASVAESALTLVSVLYTELGPTGPAEIDGGAAGRGTAPAPAAGSPAPRAALRTAAAIRTAVRPPATVIKAEHVTA